MTGTRPFSSRIQQVFQIPDSARTTGTADAELVRFYSGFVGTIPESGSCATVVDKHFLATHRHTCHAEWGVGQQVTVLLSDHGGDCPRPVETVVFYINGGSDLVLLRAVRCRF